MISDREVCFDDKDNGSWHGKSDFYEVKGGLENK